ncbi:McbB family protein [Pseudomonas sp. GT1P32]
MKLSIQNYNLLNFDCDHIVISQKGVSRINSPSLLEVIRRLNNRSSITDIELSGLFSEHNLDQEDAYKSLEGIIDIKTEKDAFYFKKIIIAHDWDDTAQFESFVLDELPSSTSLCKISELEQRITGDACNYIILACNNYEYNDLKKTYFQITSNHPENAISICYSNGDNYVIGQPYFPKIGSPCHFCSIDRLINHETYKPSKNTWSGLLSFCKNKHIPIPTPRHSLYQKCLIIGAIIQKIKLITGSNGICRFQDNILQETNLSLSNGHISESLISHWCMCDCLKVNA